MDEKTKIEIYRAGKGEASGIRDRDPITTEIVRNALNSAANQMKRTLIRASFSPIVYEVLDFAVALYDKEIRLLSQAPSLPIFMATMSFCIEAAVKAAETVDKCLGQLLDIGAKYSYDAIVIADHGNSDYLINEDGSPHTAHTMNPVPFIYVSEANKNASVSDGKLADIAPTILNLMGVDLPDEMDGEILIERNV